MKYPLFLSDFDGTLVRSDGTISEGNKRAIAAYRKAGGMFAVCTGRMLISILPRLKELGIEDGLVIAYQGATIADVATGALVKDDGFSREDALRVVRLLEENGRHVHVYTVDDLYANRRDEALEAYEHICGVRATIVSDMSLADFVEKNNLRIVKALAMVRSEERAALIEELRPKLGEDFFVTCSAEVLVEVMPKGQTKAAAVDFLSKKYNIPVEKIAAIGDQLNDLPMILQAGGRFAVGNAAQPLKDVAYVVADFEHDGVAEALAVAMQD